MSEYLHKDRLILRNAIHIDTCSAIESQRLRRQLNTNGNRHGLADQRLSASLLTRIAEMRHRAKPYRLPARVPASRQARTVGWNQVSLYEIAESGLARHEQVSLADLRLRERQDLQRLIRDDIGVLDDDLLVSASWDRHVNVVEVLFAGVVLYAKQGKQMYDALLSSRMPNPDAAMQEISVWLGNVDKLFEVAPRLRPMLTSQWEPGMLPRYRGLTRGASTVLFRVERRRAELTKVRELTEAYAHALMPAPAPNQT